ISDFPARGPNDRLRDRTQDRTSVLHGPSAAIRPGTCGGRRGTPSFFRATRRDREAKVTSANDTILVRGRISGEAAASDLRIQNGRVVSMEPASEAPADIGSAD